MSEQRIEDLIKDDISVTGQDLTTESLRMVSDDRFEVSFAPHINKKHLDRSRTIVRNALDANEKIYGVNSLFGGMADHLISPSQTSQLQATLLTAHNVGLGEALSDENVRAAMLVRINALANGHSAVRYEVLERYITLLNLGIVPVVRDLGSIGASGDLVPLAQIAGAVTGLSDRFHLKTSDGTTHPAKTWWLKNGGGQLPLLEKEGLALINGTSVHTAIVSRVWSQLNNLFELNLRAHALLGELLTVDGGAYSEFVSQLKPHHGQKAIAKKLRSYLLDSEGVVNRQDYSERKQGLIQDRYSFRCIPQFLGPIYEGMKHEEEHLRIELNSVTDNPLVDTDTDSIFHNGNFLGQQMAMTADQLRLWMALTAKHNDAQIALMVEPTFNGVLPPCLVREDSNKIDVGLKPLQIVSNSLIPLLEAKASPMSVKFPIHAEQFNQNINSQAFNAANEAEKSLELYKQQLSIFLMFVLRTAEYIQSSSATHRVLSHSGQQLLSSLNRLLLDEPAIPDTHTLEKLTHSIFEIQDTPFIDVL